MRLDRFLSHQTRLGKKLVRQKIDAGMVSVDGHVELFNRFEVDHFTTVEMDGVVLQENEAIYLMLHKPAGYLSATSDPQHPTVIDLIDETYAADLHIAGRLDRASTGLLLLTNDGRWSRSLTEPDKKVPKIYRVQLRDPVRADCAEIFSRGIYFAFEDLTTSPVELTILGETSVEITLYEGRYHQIKRMFHAIGNKVVGLHRAQIGELTLGQLPAGCYTRINQNLEII
ncbi:pseudouridine synthase [Rubritalea profundi]|uniref:Pseudouridine synthase n=1 Tax=Rubritalea profundi TaxID=1658618 RepID=A0A2S7TY73_9BACT|nr:16S rRNA pseudouridine(516) synthase [Rubritalea profundi]PQJ27074.1 16S rRNA pseudouridine(516) synthase [Rubritalea profundi]